MASSAWLCGVLCIGMAAQAATETFQVYTEHPRLLLRPRRLRLLQRERERQSMRWRQFEALTAGQARMPEPGFAGALFFQVTGDRAAGRKAIDWALGQGDDTRQQALVFDWCQALLTPSESAALANRLRQGIRRGGNGVAAASARALAAVALGEGAELERLVRQWWRAETVPALRSARPAVRREDHYALFEMLHAIRDNLNIDLREDFPALFKQLPLYQLISYYPAAYPAPENDYRVPATKGGEIDLRRATRSRAAELAMIAFEANAVDYQFLQGWLMNDRFLMRGPEGVPYEFLWGNPYQPGLSFHNLPTLFHDTLFGRLFARSGWDDDARWIGYIDGQLQTFENNAPKILGRQTVEIGNCMVVAGVRDFHVDRPEGGPVFVLGLKSRTRYEVDVENEEMREETTDPGGILALSFEPGARAEVHIRESVPAGQAPGRPVQ